MKCSISGCDRPREFKNYCGRCYISHGRNVGTQRGAGPSLAALVNPVRTRPEDLIDAAQMGKVSQVRTMLDHGLNPSLVNGVLKMTPTIKAAENGQTEVVKLLASRGADLEYQNRDGKTALMFAVRFNKIATVRCLVEDLRVDLHKRSKDGRTAVMYASHLGNCAMVTYLISRGARADNRENVLLFPDNWSGVEEQEMQNAINDGLKARGAKGKFKFDEKTPDHLMYMVGSRTLSPPPPPEFTHKQTQEIKGIIAKQGWLSKKDPHGLPMLRTWKRRYLVLQGGVLRYYANETDHGNVDPKGTVPCSEFKNLTIHGDEKSGGRRFDVTIHNGRTFAFRADSRDDAVAWYNALNNAARR